MFSPHQSTSDETPTAPPPAYSEGDYNDQVLRGFHRNTTQYPTLSQPSSISGAPPTYSKYGRNERQAKRVTEVTQPSIANTVETRQNYVFSLYTIDDRIGLVMKFKIIAWLLLLALFFTLLVLGILHDPRAKENFTKNDTSCTPITPTTLLFAYSNDLDSDMVLKVWHDIDSYYVPPLFIKFANIRFDVRREDDIQFHNDLRDVNASIQSYLPNPSLGFGDSNTGSDVFKMIEKFLNNSQAPICGSQIFILAKRYPNETEIGGLVANLQQHHVTVTVLYSVEPSGGYHSEILYNIATKTNGFSGFNRDIEFEREMIYVSPCDRLYLIYAANPQVSEKGNISLAPMRAPNIGSYLFTMTVQDQASFDYSATVELKWSGIEASSSRNLGVSGGKSTTGNYFGNFVAAWEILEENSYNMSLNYEYSNNNVKTLQIRVYSRKSVNYWIPYDN